MYFSRQLRARTSRLGPYLLVLVGTSERRERKGRSVHSQVLGGGGEQWSLIWKEELFYFILLGSFEQDVKTERWVVSCRKGSCIPESTGLGSRSGEGWLDIPGTEQLAAGYGERLGQARPVAQAAWRGRNRDEGSLGHVPRGKLLPQSSDCIPEQVASFASFPLCVTIRASCSLSAPPPLAGNHCAVAKRS